MACQSSPKKRRVSVQLSGKARRRLLFGFYPIRAWVRLYDSPSNLIILP